MTILEAIAWLEVLRGKHGENVSVYFDCPKCGAAFTPSKLVSEVTPAVVIQAATR